MEVRWLEDFLALARTRHFSRAAELQHVSQPTFSRRIKLLEEAMGSTLINRQTLPLSLTPAGEIFRELCERITRDVRDTRDRITALEAEVSARISVGSTQGLFSHFYQGWARDAGIAERLQLNLNATSWVGEQFLEALDSGECDLVLCYWHPDLPWGGRLTANLLPLNENTQSASIKALVKQGFGMGWLPRRMTEKSEQFGSLARAGDESWDVPLEIRLIRLRDTRSEDLLTLWKTLEDGYA